MEKKMNKTTTYLRNTLTIAVFILAISAIQILAATFTVTNINDSGAGSLRQAVLDANAAAGDDLIAFDASFNVPRTLTLASTITVTGNGGLTVNGPGASLLTVSGNNAVSVFHVSGQGAPSIGAIVFNNLTVADGRFGTGQTAGAGIGINSGGADPTLVNFTANNVVFRNNQGGGAEAAGSAISCSRSGTVAVNNSTFTENRGSTINLGSGIGSCSATINGSSFYRNSGDGVISCCGNNTTVTVSVNNSVFYNNGNDFDGSTIDMSSGGGIAITNTTIANNRSSRAAVWLRNFSISNNSLTNVTIAGNSIPHSTLAAGLEIGITVPVTIGNSIIANNFNASGADDVEIGGTGGTIISQGYNMFETVSGAGTISGNTTGNLIGVDPWLDGTPRNNGGATRTLALRPGSPAIDAGNPTTFPATDQRGITRPLDGDGNGNSRSDIGAYEKRLIDVVQTQRTDFDGDGKTDISIFRPSVGEWWYLRSSNGGNGSLQFGNTTDKLVPADFTGDGKTDIAFWRPGTGFWFILRSEDNSFFSFPFGTSGDVPIVGDFDGDGKADPTVFRPSSLTWFINKSSGGTTITTFGASGDVPVSSDYDGDGKTDIAIYRPSVGEWWINRSSSGQTIAFQFGTATDKPVQGDWTGDGVADAAFFRPSTGVWFILRSEDSSFYSVPFGSSGDSPSPGDYDGDGKFDTAVFRPSSSTWFIQRSIAGTQIQGFGTAGDVSVPNAFVP